MLLHTVQCSILQYGKVLYCIYVVLHGIVLHTYTALHGGKVLHTVWFPRLRDEWKRIPWG